MRDDDTYDDDSDVYDDDVQEAPPRDAYDDDVVGHEEYREDVYGEDRTEYEQDAYDEDDGGSWWDEGLIGLLLVAGIVLFFFPEPITSTIGIALLAVGVLAWVADALT